MTVFVKPTVVVMCLLGIAPTLLADTKAAAPTLHVVRDKSDRPVAVEAVGLPAADLAKLPQPDDASDRYSRVLAVYTAAGKAGADLPPMAGRWSVAESSLKFTPRFPLIAGARYRAVLDPAALVRSADSKNAPAKESAKSITLEFTVPADEPGEPTEVVQIFPSSSVLPENNLRFYIHFSQSMGRGEAYQHLSLVNAKGEAIDLPFLEIGEELWDPRARRMTLLIDPGRIKKGVKPREDQGPVLESGREYSLVVGREWPDASGRPLKAEFRKKFRAGPAVETAIDPTHWKITPPDPGSGDPLVVRFSSSLDRALLERTLSVSTIDGPAIAGRVTVSDEERRWEFRPLAPWQAGRYQLVVETALEDLAGNRIGKPFEIDEFSQVDKTAETEPARLPFEIRPRS